MSFRRLLNRPAATRTLASRAITAALMACTLATLSLCTVLVPAALAGAPRILGASAVPVEPEARVVSHSSTSVDLEFSFPTVLAEDLSVEGRTYQLLTIPGGASSGEVGEPMLPTFSRMVMIPDRAGVQITVAPEDVEELSGFRVLPMQSEDGTGFALNESSYSRIGYGNAPQGTIGSPALVRGLRVVPLTLSPVQYSPGDGKVRVARHMRVNVSFSGENPLNAASKPLRSITPSFDRLYRSMIVNYEGPPETVAVEGGTWLLIYDGSAEVLSRIQPLVDWRTRTGMQVRVVTTAETGSTAQAIQAYIRNAYNNWAYPPEYIVLVGDAAGPYSLPTWFEQVGYNGEGDLPYCELDGDDILADAHIGRLSFNTLTELDVIVAKIVGYESAPDVTDPSWFSRATLVGDPYDSGYSTVMVQQWIKTRLRQISYSQIDTIFNSPFVSQMLTSLNRGGTIFCYRGIYGMSGWNNSHTNTLTNYNKLYYGVMSTCGTGSFAQGTARSEAFLRVGTVDSPKGAVGAIGTATTGTHTRFNNCFTFGVFQGLLYEDMYEMGAALTRGKYELYANYEQAAPDYVIMFSYWNNLMGDPACKVWTAFPAPLTVDYPSTVFYRANTVQITVRKGASPCPDAQVCLWKGNETFVTGTTDSQGRCELAVSLATPGAMKLTVTRHNSAPFMSDIAVTTLGSFVSLEGSLIDDDASGASLGNGDGQVGPTESIELGVQVRNEGSAPLDSVRAVLTSNDPYVNVIDPNAFFGAIQPGATIWSADSFLFSVSPGCPEGHVLRFGLNVTAGTSQWHSLVELSVVSSDLQAGTVTLYNSGNGRLDPGETLELSIPLSDAAGIDAAGVSAVLSSTSPWLSIIDDEASYGTIPAGLSGENSADRFTVAASAGAYQGHLAVLRLVTTFNGGALDTTYTAVTVGQASSDDPVGPDQYGYCALDNTDTAYAGAPTFSWIEINPSLGGSGVQVQLGDYTDYQDRSLAMNLPFTFRFYGQSYNRATICSNGWIAMGDTYLTDYRNWTLPGAGCPQSLIAVFWDDLKETGSGHVYQYFDAPNHRWIVEWSRMLNAAGNVLETFEAVLYDPMYYPTISADGIILFQYNDVRNTDSVDGYSTVGIQNRNHTDGLLYTYFNLYPAAAAPLGAGRAIKIIPVTTDVTAAPVQGPGAPLTSLAPSSSNPFRGSTTIRFSLSQAEPARLTVYDIQGREVRELLHGPRGAGVQSVPWDGDDDRGRSVPSGVYFYQLEAEGKSLVRKVMKLE